jgi:hypothetical protein
MNDEDLDKMNQFLKGRYTRGIYALYAFTHGYANKATEALELRLKLNLDDTGHPFHHKTQDGTIVEPDPAIEHLFSSIPADDRELVIKRWTNRIKPDAPAAQPVDRRHYGDDYYWGWQEIKQDERLNAATYHTADPVQSGSYSYFVWPGEDTTPPLQIRSHESKLTFCFTLRETLDLLRLLQSYETDLEELLADDQEEDEVNEEEEQEDEE